MNRLRSVALGLVIAAGLVTLLASSLEEQRITLPPVPVTVEYSLTTVGTGTLSRELETRNAIVSLMDLTGSYGEVNSGDGLTLDRSIVDLDTNSSFTLEIEPKGDELLTGTAAIVITSSLDYGLGRNPTRGQITSQLAGTSTFVDVTSSGVDVLVGTSSQRLSLSWTDFVAREDDADANLDERMASAAYNMLSAVMRAVLAVEDIVSDVESVRGTLESIGVVSLVDGLENEPPCDNLATDQGDPARARLTWTFDASGVGEGELGVNDRFVAEYRNCRFSQRTRFLNGDVSFSDYMPDRGPDLRTLEVTAQLNALFNSESAFTDFDTVAAAASPLYNGALSLSYVEVVQ